MKKQPSIWMMERFLSGRWYPQHGCSGDTQKQTIALLLIVCAVGGQIAPRDTVVDSGVVHFINLIDLSDTVQAGWVMTHKSFNLHLSDSVEIDSLQIVIDSTGPGWGIDFAPIYYYKIDGEWVRIDIVDSLPPIHVPPTPNRPYLEVRTYRKDSPCSDSFSH